MVSPSLHRSLLLLPDEDVYSKVDGVWNLSSDQGAATKSQMSHVSRAQSAINLQETELADSIERGAI